MRISDWSSDVCSSDLSRCRWRRLPCNCTEASEHGYGHGGRSMKRPVLAPYSQTPIAIISFRTSAGETAFRDENPIIAGHTFAAHLAKRLDRKSVVEGKSVSVRVDLGDASIIKKKKQKRKTEE